MDKIKRIILTILIIVNGMLCVILSAYICTAIMTVIGIQDTLFAKVTMTWLSMLFGFCIIPTCIIKKIYHITRFDVGIGLIKRNEIIICMLILSMTIVYLIIDRHISDSTIWMIAIIQNLAVAFFEEYFSKGILYYMFKKITNNRILILLICSFVFAFVFHSSDYFWINLQYRLPMAIILGICYMRTNNLYLPITLHLVNNLLATSMLK